MSLLSGVNYQFLGSVAILFVIMRMSSNDYYSIPKLLLKDLRLYYNGALIKVSNTLIHHIRYIMQQPKYRLYDTLVNISICSVMISIYLSIINCLENSSSIGTVGQEMKPKNMLNLGNIFLIFTFLLSAYSTLKMLYGAGQKPLENGYLMTETVNEMKYPFLYSKILFAFLLFMFIKVDDIKISKDRYLFQVTIRHLNSLFGMLSISVQPVDDLTLLTAVKLTYAMLCSILSMGSVLTSFRFTKLFYSMMFNPMDVSKVLVIIDQFVSPVLVIFTFGLECYKPMDVASTIDPQLLVYLQVTSIVLMVSLRLYLMRTYIQCFLQLIQSSKKNSSVSGRYIISEDIAVAKSNGLIPASLQYISHITLIISIAFTIYNHTEGGINACKYVTSCLTNKDYNTPYSSTIDATEAVINATGKPYFDQAIYLFLMSAGEGGVSPSKLINDFWKKAITEISLLPNDVFLYFSKLLILIYIASWFAVNLFVLILTYYNDVKETTTSSSATAAEPLVSDSTTTQQDEVTKDTKKDQ